MDVGEDAAAGNGGVGHELVAASGRPQVQLRKRIGLGPPGRKFRWLQVEQEGPPTTTSTSPSQTQLLTSAKELGLPKSKSGSKPKSMEITSTRPAPPARILGFKIGWT